MSAFGPLRTSRHSASIRHMRAELRQLLTVEHEDPSVVRPDDEAFCISLRAMIGPMGSEGEESFDFDVCSPAWFHVALKADPVVSGRFMLVAESFDLRRIEQYVRKRVAQATGPDWPTIAGKLARWSRWEFED